MYQSTRRDVPEDLSTYQHSAENLKSHADDILWVKYKYISAGNNNNTNTSAAMCVLQYK